MSLLTDLRSNNLDKENKATEAYNAALRACPPVSQALIAYLDNMFSRKIYQANEPMLEQCLVYQAGIDKVLAHLRSQNDRQEQRAREQAIKRKT